MFKALKNKVNSFAGRVQAVVSDKKGEGFVDTGIKILISVVIGALVLGGLYVLFGDTILPTLTTKVTDLFNHAG